MENGKVKELYYDGNGDLRSSGDTKYVIKNKQPDLNNQVTAESVANILLQVNKASKKDGNKNKFMKDDANTTGKDVLEKYFSYNPQNNENREEYDKKFKSALCKQILFAVSGLASRCIGDNRIGLNKTVKHHFRHWSNDRLSKMLDEISQESCYKFFNDACIGYTRGAKETKEANKIMTELVYDLNNFLNNKSGHVKNMDNMDMNQQVVRLLNVVDSYCQDIHRSCTTCGCKGLDAVPFWGGHTTTSAFRQGRRGAYRIMDKFLPDHITRAGSHNLSKYDCVLNLGKTNQESTLEK